MCYEHIWMFDCVYMAYTRRYFKFFSHILARSMEVLHFGDWGYPMIIFPTSRGRFFDLEDRGIISSLRAHLDRGYLQVFCVDTLDWEALLAPGASLVGRRERWLALERHWTEEFIPFVRTQAGNDFLVVAGCSLGATHALNLALRNPALIRRVLAMGGPYDLCAHGSLFGESPRHECEQEFYFVNPMAYMANMHLDTWRKLGGDGLDIKLLTAREDFCLGDHLRLAELMDRNGIPHHLEVWEGNHDWPVWCAQIAAFA
jgi:esterase/lipase superfamily enzyme